MKTSTRTSRREIINVFEQKWLELNKMASAKMAPSSPPATTEKESPRGGSSQGQKAGLFFERKPKEQAAPFYFPVSFKASCLPSRVTEHEVDVSFIELAMASRAIAPDA